MRIPKLLLILLGGLAARITFAEISVGRLSRAEAAGLGFTMKQAPDGEAGVKVWLEFRKEGVLEKFTYAEMRLETPGGSNLVSARLQPHPVAAGQARELVSVAFSAEPSQLVNCAFLVVAYGSSRGDVGYLLRVKDLLDLPEKSPVAGPGPAQTVPGATDRRTAAPVRGAGEFRVGQDAPVLDGIFADGSPLDPKDLSGRVVLFAFWSEESGREPLFSTLRAIRREFRMDDRLRLVSVCVNSDWDGWLRLCSQPLDAAVGPHPTYDSDPTWWQVFLDTAAEHRRPSFRVPTGKEIYLVGPEGRVLGVHPPDARLRTVVAEALCGGK